MRPELTQVTSLLRSDDPIKLEEALRILQRTVYSFSMKVCGHPEDAEDTTQEVLLKSLRYLAKIESPQALAVWLYKVTRNRCWMSRRRSKFAPKETLALEDLMPDSAELASLSSAPQQTPEAHAISTQERERLHEAILRIPSSYRLVLALHDMEGLDTTEVAKVMGLQEGTVRVRLHRARLFLRRELVTPTASSPASSSRTGGESRPMAEISQQKTSHSKKPVDCREIFANLSEYLDGRMSRLNCERLRVHLEDCPPCVAFIADLQRAVERCQKFEVPCEPATADKLRKLLAQEYLRVVNRSNAPAASTRHL
jgi:RNA polymerase sigma-70 factor (ECF subfamily)